MALSIEQLFTAIAVKRPQIKEFLDEHGEKPLAEYGQRLFELRPPQTFLERFDDIAAVLRDIVPLRFPDAAIDALLHQLRQLPLVSTVDHLGSVAHPFFINPHLLLALSAKKHPYYKYVVVFANSTISLNNSEYPKGLLFHDGHGQLVRLPFFSSKLNMVPVFAAPPFTYQVIETQLQNITHLALRNEAKQRLMELIVKLFMAPDVLASDSYSEQTSKVSGTLWRTMASANYPQLIYLDEERIVLELIRRFHLHQSTIINKILFDANVRASFCKAFAGFPGSLDEQGGGGTTLFWAIDPGSEKRVSLVLAGSRLKSGDDRMTIELNAKALEHALATNTIMPSALLTFVTLSFYYQLICLGGFSQIDLLTRMAKVWREFARTMDISIQDDLSTIVNQFGENLVLAYLELSNFKMVPATLVDLLMHVNDAPWQELAQTSKNVSVKQSFIPLLPDMYRVLYREKERNVQHLRLSSSELMASARLHDQVAPVARL